MRKILAIALFWGVLWADFIDDLEKKPKGIVRDFYIFEALQGEVTPPEALKLYALAESRSPSLIKALKNKVPRDLLPREIYCRDLGLPELIKSDDACFNLGFRLGFAQDSRLDSAALARLSEKARRQVKIIRAKNALEAAINASGEDFSDIYFALKDRGDLFNHAPKNPQNLSNKNLGRALYHLVISQKFPRFTTALLRANIVGVDDLSFFALGLNELKNGGESAKKVPAKAAKSAANPAKAPAKNAAKNPAESPAKNKKSPANLAPHLQKAANYFAAAANATKSLFLRDRAVFWQYLITQDSRLLERLAQSELFNLYSLFAVRKLGVPPRYSIIRGDDEIFAALSDKAPPFDIKDPFEWQKMSQNIAQIKDKEALLQTARGLFYKDSLPHLSAILNRYYDFGKKFFITPYYDDLELSLPTKTLVYAVAKQESRFVPTVVSRSFALGMMQIMPFNVAPFAKALKEEGITNESMFDPRVALRFGAYYLEHLWREFKHPLFVSYAYNGGPGFVRNFLGNAANFSAQNPLDPWLSMEFVPYEESRIYGMKVAANYIMYNEIEGNIIDVEAFLRETLR